jgi:hypothetical protein
VLEASGRAPARQGLCRRAGIRLDAFPHHCPCQGVRRGHQPLRPAQVDNMSQTKAHMASSRSRPRTRTPRWIRCSTPPQGRGSAALCSATDTDPHNLWRSPPRGAAARTASSSEDRSAGLAPWRTSRRPARWSICRSPGCPNCRQHRGAEKAGLWVFGAAAETGSAVSRRNFKRGVRRVIGSRGRHERVGKGFVR